MELLATKSRKKTQKRPELIHANLRSERGGRTVDRGQRTEDRGQRTETGGGRPNKAGSRSGFTPDREAGKRTENTVPVYTPDMCALLMPAGITGSVSRRLFRPPRCWLLPARDVSAFPGGTVGLPGRVLRATPSRTPRHACAGRMSDVLGHEYARNAGKGVGRKSEAGDRWTRLTSSHCQLQVIR